MPWVRFTENFDFSHRYGSTTAYKAGMVLNVTRRCAGAALAAKRAVRLRKPNRDAAPIEDSQDDN
jgi:hypothetical protein